MKRIALLLLLLCSPVVASAQTLPTFWSGLSKPECSSIEITGGSEVNDTLTCETTWANGVIQESFQWYDGVTPIDGATESSYDTGDEEAGDLINCRVTGRNAAGAMTAQSNSIELGAGEVEGTIVLEQPSAILVNNSGGNATFEFTPTVLAGEADEFDIIAGTLPGSLTEGSNFDPETGQLTGSVGSSYGSGSYVIRATNAAFESVQETPFEFYDIVVRWHKYTSTGTISDTGALQYLNTAGRLYTLSEDVYAPGVALVINAAGVAVDGAGFTAHNNQATPINVADYSFEAVNDWDFTSAPNAAQFAGAFLSNTLWDGSNSLRFSCPAADNEYVESNGTLALEPNTDYVVFAYCSFGDNTTGKDFDDNPGVNMYVELVGTGAEDAVRAEKSTSNARGIQFTYFEFTTGSGTPTYNMRIGIEDGDLSAGPDVYFDYVGVCRSRPAGIVVGPVGSPAEPTEIASLGLGTDATIANITISPGSDKGFRNHAVLNIQSHNVAVVGCDLTCNGPDSSIYLVHDQTSQVCALVGNEMASTNLICSNRDQGYGDITWTAAGVFAHNNVTDGPISGFYIGATNNRVCFNTIKLKGRYTNNFAYSLSGGTLGYRNTLINTASPYASRGIGMAPAVTIFANAITSREEGNNQEYSGIPLASCHLHQQEYHTGDATYTNESYTLLGANGGTCFRLGPDEDSLSTGVITFDRCIGIVDVTGNVASNGGETAACIKPQWMDLDLYKFDDCVFETNACFFYADGALAGVLEIDRPSIAYTDDNIDYDLPWIVGYPSDQDLAATVTDPEFADAGTRTWFKQVPQTWPGGTPSGVIAITVQNTVTVTFTAAGNPVANTAVTIDDEQSNEVYDGTTDSNGQIAFIAKDYVIGAAAISERQTHTFNVAGYDPETADLTDTNKTPTVALTAL